MAELRAVLAEAGYGDVETHIQTGNVRLTARTRSRDRLEGEVEALLERDRGFRVDVVALTPRELTELEADIDDVAAQHPAEHRHYVSLLKQPATREQARVVEEHGVPDEVVVVHDRAVHFLYLKPYHGATMSNATIERRLGVATNRNVTVLRALAAKWGAA